MLLSVNPSVGVTSSSISKSGEEEGGVSLPTANLIVNPDAEIYSGGFTGWTEISSTWSQRNSTEHNPDAQSGQNYFFAGTSVDAELIQDIDVTAYSSYISAKTIKFTFSGWITDYNTDDTSHIIVEYRNSGGTVLTSYNTGESYPTSAVTGTSTWNNYTDTIIPPPTTATIRIRLISTRYAGTNNDGYYDNLSLVGSAITYPYSPALTPTLHGANVTDFKTISDPYAENYEYDCINYYNTNYPSNSINAKVDEGWSLPQEFYLTRTGETLYDYVPQGFYAQSNGICWISMPHKTESACSATHASLAVKFDTVNNELLAVYHLRNFGNTADHDCHGGGLVYTTGTGGNYLIISNDDRLFHFNLASAVLVQDGGIEYTLPQSKAPLTMSYPGGSPNDNISALGMSNDHNGDLYLWTTDFDTTNNREVIGYPIDNTGEITQTTADYRFPCNNANLRYMQGIQVTSATADEYKILISRAVGNSDSKLVEASFLDDGGSFNPSLAETTAGTDKFFGPRGSEGVTVHGTTAWVVFEAGCAKFETNDSWKYNFPYILKIDVS